MEIVTWNIPLSNGKTENSLLGVWFWGSVSHFRSRPFVTGSYVLHVTGKILACVDIYGAWGFVQYVTDKIPACVNICGAWGFVQYVTG